MPTMADITVYDGKATPAAHVLYAIEMERKNAMLRAFYRSAVSGVPLEAQERMYLSREILRSGVHRYDVRYEAPVMESVAGQNAAGYTAAPKVAYVDVAGFYVFSHPRSMAQGKKDARQIVTNFVRGLLTTQTPDTAGPAISAFDHGIMPS